MADPATAQRTAVDPDPFSIGIAIFSAMAGGAAFLETRRSRVHDELAQRQAFRSAWFRTRRSLIYFKRSIDEFETYMLEDRYSRKSFRIGAVRVAVEGYRKQEMRRLKSQALTTANTLSNNLDDLSDFLGPQDQAGVDALLARLAGIAHLPDRYSDLVHLCREVLVLYADLVDEIGDRERFDEDGGYSTSTV